MQETIRKIRPVKAEFVEEAQRRLDNLTKPPGSLGRLEEFARRLVSITENTMPSLDKKVIFTFAGDHGVAEEGVSAYPKEVTKQMVFNFMNGGAGINVLARHAGAEVVVVDIGVDFDFDSPPSPPFAKGRDGGTLHFKKGCERHKEHAKRSCHVQTGSREKHRNRHKAGRGIRRKGL